MRYRHKQNHNPHKNARPLTPEQVERALGGSVLVKAKAPLSGGAIEAQQLLEKANQLKEKAMPDLNTALRNALDNSKRQALAQTLDAWDKDEKETQLEKPVTTNTIAMTSTQKFTSCGNASKDAFNYVLINPGCNSKQVAQALPMHNPTSIKSLLTQFVVQGYIRLDTYGMLFPKLKEYKPLMARNKWNKLHAPAPEVKPEVTTARKVVVIKRRTAQDVAAAQANEGIAGLVAAPTWTPEEAMAKLNVIQARQLYDFLKNLFGG